MVVESEAASVHPCKSCRDSKERAHIELANRLHLQRNRQGWKRAGSGGARAKGSGTWNQRKSSVVAQQDGAKTYLGCHDGLM